MKGRVVVGELSVLFIQQRGKSSLTYENLLEGIGATQMLSPLNMKQ